MKRRPTMEMEPDLRPGSIASQEKEVKLVRYLEKKVRGEPLPPNVDIPEVNLYGDTEPSELFDRAKTSPGKPIFFFTKLTNKIAKRMLRSCGWGKWKGKTAGKVVKLEDEVVIGVRKTFIFIPSRKGNGDSDDKFQQQLDQEDGGQLSMVEYSLGDGKVAVSDYVICKIEYKKSSTSSPKKKKNTTKSATNNHHHHQFQGSKNDLMQESAGKPSSSVANKTSKRTNPPENQENRCCESDLNHKRVRSSMNTTNEEGQSATKMLDAGEFLYHGPGVQCTLGCFLP